MNRKFFKALKNLHENQKGMTGLETAIILIAFVTVASVLAYSVLSAGIFSAEKSKATVYSGLASAQSTLELKGLVIGLSTNNTAVNSIQLALALTLPDQSIDKNQIIFNYFDAGQHVEGITPTSFALATGSAERGNANFIERDEIFFLTLPLSAAPSAYENFTVQIVPPAGASLTINRTAPGKLTPVVDLQ